MQCSQQVFELKTMNIIAFENKLLNQVVFIVQKDSVGWEIK